MQNCPSLHVISEQFLRQKWLSIFGNKYDIYISDIYKPDNGCFGISLKGIANIADDREIGGFDCINILLPDGIIGKEGILKPGDIILQVNDEILFGKNHDYIVARLQAIKHQIKLVCARPKIEQLTSVVHHTQAMEKLHLTNLWSNSLLNIELNKNDDDIGFSVSDYQDPSNPNYSPVIVIRELVPGGIAQLDGRIFPGDRLVAVNDITFENMNSDDVMKILKSTPKGPVKLSLSKPLSYSKFTNDNDQNMNNNQNEGSQLMLQMEQLRGQWLQGLISLNVCLNKMKQLLNETNINE
ncbi:unnamed protein product [Rotaria sp. Silwood2]|nr:unnamed protein product [Rotaria sp. Silwood2]CAF3170552.1 unnamed protein product [Rotaria sp. Silwood2]CAF3263412.1 unnamed protein product [Rotaria sp. Silwood2]CAF4523933.1 unnamed protein product [Rotaria sp. Silwood2]CAF4698287.1 unnamed protein product [Rotaria sp. Silwood2]